MFDAIDYKSVFHREYFDPYSFYNAKHHF